MSERIETMRTFFTARGHDVDPIAVAAAQFRKSKRVAIEDLQEFSLTTSARAALLEVALGDPNEPVDAPVLALVNNGRWIAPCECGGAEIVDPVTRLFMCASCFNARHEYLWRLVGLPDDTTRLVIEQALLMRPDQRTRNWRPDESVADLIVENVEHGLMRPGDEIRVELGVATVVPAPLPTEVTDGLG